MKVTKEGKAPWSGIKLKCSHCESEMVTENFDIPFGVEANITGKKTLGYYFNCKVCGVRIYYEIK